MVSEKLPTKEQALQILRQSGCRRNVIKHCEAVAKLALEIAEACHENGLDVDLELVQTGALLHDIGRSKTHDVHHAIIGAEIAKSFKLPEPVLAIIKRHVGGGITAKEAEKLGWPKDIYIPKTLEEKIVAYVDKLIEGSRRVPIEKALRSFSRKLPPPAVERVRRLHDEMLTLVGDYKCLL